MLKLQILEFQEFGYEIMDKILVELQDIWLLKLCEDKTMELL